MEELKKATKIPKKEINKKSPIIIKEKVIKPKKEKVNKDTKIEKESIIKDKIITLFNELQEYITDKDIKLSLIKSKSLIEIKNDLNDWDLTFVSLKKLIPKINSIISNTKLKEALFKDNLKLIKNMTKKGEPIIELKNSGILKDKVIKPKKDKIIKDKIIKPKKEKIIKEKVIKPKKEKDNTEQNIKDEKVFNLFLSLMSDIELEINKDSIRLSTGTRKKFNKIINDYKDSLEGEYLTFVNIRKLITQLTKIILDIPRLSSLNFLNNLNAIKKMTIKKEKFIDLPPNKDINEENIDKNMFGPSIESVYNLDNTNIKKEKNDTKAKEELIINSIKNKKTNPISQKDLYKENFINRKIEKEEIDISPIKELEKLIEEMFIINDKINKNIKDKIRLDNILKKTNENLIEFYKDNNHIYTKKDINIVKETINKLKKEKSILEENYKEIETKIEPKIETKKETIETKKERDDKNIIIYYKLLLRIQYLLNNETEYNGIKNNIDFINNLINNTRKNIIPIHNIDNEIEIFTIIENKIEKKEKFDIVKYYNENIKEKPIEIKDKPIENKINWDEDQMKFRKLVEAIDFREDKKLENYILLGQDIKEGEAYKQYLLVNKKLKGKFVSKDFNVYEILNAYNKEIQSIKFYLDIDKDLTRLKFDDVDNEEIDFVKKYVSKNDDGSYNRSKDDEFEIYMIDVIEKIDEFIREKYNVKKNDNIKYYILKSVSPNKISYHIIFNDLLFKNMRDLKSEMADLLIHFQDENLFKYGFIDSVPYNTNQLIRLINNTKKGKKNNLKFSEFYLNNLYNSNNNNFDKFIDFRDDFIKNHTVKTYLLINGESNSGGIRKYDDMKKKDYSKEKNKKEIELKNIIKKEENLYKLNEEQLKEIKILTSIFYLRKKEIIELIEKILVNFKPWNTLQYTLWLRDFDRLKKDYIDISWYIRDSINEERFISTKQKLIYKISYLFNKVKIFFNEIIDKVKIFEQKMWTVDAQINALKNSINDEFEKISDDYKLLQIELLNKLSEDLNNNNKNYIFNILNYILIQTINIQNNDNYNDIDVFKIEKTIIEDIKFKEYKKLIENKEFSIRILKNEKQKTEIKNRNKYLLNIERDIKDYEKNYPGFQDRYNEEYDYEKDNIK